MNRQLYFVIIASCVQLLGELVPCAASGDEYWDDVFGVPGAQFGVTSVVVTDGAVYLSGNLVSVSEVGVTKIAVWDGKRWEDLKSSPFTGSLIKSVAQIGDQVFAGGLFTEIGGIRANNIARWDGNRWFALGGGVNGGVGALAVSEGGIFVGGSFTSAGGIAARRVAKWDGTKWSALGSGVSRTNVIRDLSGEHIVDDAGVAALLVHGKDVYVGGSFDWAGEQEAQNIAKWDGQKWSALGSGVRRNTTKPFGGVVRALAWHRDNLIVGGEFRFAGEVETTGIARWDGSRWHGFGKGVTEFGDIQALESNRALLFAAGGFTDIDGVSAIRIAAWDGEQWFRLGSGINQGGATALAAANGQLFVGGQFTMVGNKPATNIALWHIPRALKVQREASTLSISWPKPDTNPVLQASESLVSTNWSDVPIEPSLEQNRLTVKEPLTMRQKFYRLRQR